MSRPLPIFLSVLLAVSSAFPAAGDRVTFTSPRALTLNHQTAVRFLRQATWGPDSRAIDQLKAGSFEAFLADQFAKRPTVFPPELSSESLEYLQEFWMRMAMTGQDQLRSRTAWALSQIWVVSAVEVDCTEAMVEYSKNLHASAFGNFRDLMKTITLTPAMGEYLDMVNNGKGDPAQGIMPNENFGRELLQLFTIGLNKLNIDGSSVLDANGQPIPTYSQADVVAISRAFTGWTYNDGKVGPPSEFQHAQNYRLPMEPVASQHDTGSKTFLGATIPAGQTPQQDLDQALDIVFNHPNVGPFIGRHLIQRLVTSNPTPAHIRAAAEAFNNNGQGVRGDLKAVLTAILLHPDAQATLPNDGKLQEPALFITAMLRALDARVTDTPYITDFTKEMGQNLFYSPSVFNYYSPFFRAPNTNILGPEFQIFTNSISLSRANFVARLLRGDFNSGITVYYAPYQMALLQGPDALLDKISNLFLGGTMPSQLRSEIKTAMQKAESTDEKIQTALYLTLTSPLYQVER
jgi:uncharacterized protein (DUF1800 family)